MGKRRRPRSEPAAPDRAAPPPRTPSPPRSTSPSTPPRSQLRLPRHTRLRPTTRDTSPAQPPRNTAPQPSSAGQPPPVRRHRPAAPHPRPGSATRRTAGARAPCAHAPTGPAQIHPGRRRSTDGSTCGAAGTRTDPPRQGQGVDVSTEARPGHGQIRRGTDGSTMARPGDGAHPPAPPRDAPLPGDSATPTRSSPGMRLAYVWPASGMRMACVECHRHSAPHRHGGMPATQRRIQHPRTRSHAITPSPGTCGSTMTPRPARPVPGASAPETPRTTTPNPAPTPRHSARRRLMTTEHAALKHPRHTHARSRRPVWSRPRSLDT